MGAAPRSQAIPTPRQVYDLFVYEGRYWRETAMERWGTRISRGTLAKLLREGKRLAAGEVIEAPVKKNRTMFTPSEIEGALSVSGGSATRAARLLGCNTTTVYTHINKSAESALPTAGVVTRRRNARRAPSRRQA